MTKRVEVLEKKSVFKKAIFDIEEIRIRHEKYDGSMSDVLTRLNLNRGDSAAVLLHDVSNNTLILTEQFRPSTYNDPGSGWILEIPAGSVEKGEEPMATMKRELIEEIGYEVKEMQHLFTFYVSPGGTSERIFLYYAQARPENVIGQGGGVLHEGEDIKRIAMPVAVAMQKLQKGEFTDAKTLIALQWLLNHQKA